MLIQEYVHGLTRAISHDAVTTMEEPKGLVEGTLEKFIDASKVEPSSRDPALVLKERQESILACLRAVLSVVLDRV